MDDEYVYKVLYHSGRSFRVTSDDPPRAFIKKEMKTGKKNLESIHHLTAADPEKWALVYPAASGGY
jgi:hypothetical protein